MAAPGSMFAPAYWADTTPTIELELGQLFPEQKWLSYSLGFHWTLKYSPLLNLGNPFITLNQPGLIRLRRIVGVQWSWELKVGGKPRSVSPPTSPPASPPPPPPPPWSGTPWTAQLTTAGRRRLGRQLPFWRSLQGEEWGGTGSRALVMLLARRRDCSTLTLLIATASTSLTLNPRFSLPTAIDRWKLFGKFNKVSFETECGSGLNGYGASFQTDGIFPIMQSGWCSFTKLIVI